MVESISLFITQNIAWIVVFVALGVLQSLLTFLDQSMRLLAPKFIRSRMNKGRGDYERREDPNSPHDAAMESLARKVLTGLNDLTKAHQENARATRELHMALRDHMEREERAQEHMRSIITQVLVSRGAQP